MNVGAGGKNCLQRAENDITLEIGYLGGPTLRKLYQVASREEMVTSMIRVQVTFPDRFGWVYHGMLFSPFLKHLPVPPRFLFFPCVA